MICDLGGTHTPHPHLPIMVPFYFHNSPCSTNVSCSRLGGNHQEASWLDVPYFWLLQNQLSTWQAAIPGVWDVWICVLYLILLYEWVLKKIVPQGARCFSYATGLCFWCLTNSAYRHARLLHLQLVNQSTLYQRQIHYEVVGIGFFGCSDDVFHCCIVPTITNILCNGGSKQDWFLFDYANQRTQPLNVKGANIVSI